MKVTLDTERMRSVLEGIRTEAEAGRFASASQARAALERCRALAVAGLSIVADGEQVALLREAVES